MMESSPRLCAVEFLNTRPIVYGLQSNRIAHRFTLSYAHPAECAERLRRREVDAALIPSIEYSHIRGLLDLQIVPEIAVTSHGAVGSVELFFNRGLSDVRRIAVDEKSRTSVALLQIILREKYDIEAELIPASPDIDRMLGFADAALIIGDRALELSRRMDNRLDLGDEWADLTDGLPFVYSFWAGVRGALTDQDVDILIQSRDLGLASIEAIASEGTASSDSDIAESRELVQYLSGNIQYHLGKAELDGLKEFFSYCYYYGFVNEIPEFQFYPHMETALR